MRAVAAAFTFLTRLPVWSGPLRDEDFGRAVAFFPLVGLVLGLALTGLGFALGDAVSPLLLAVLLAALLGALTGGLHLDGVADVFDGLGGGRGDRVRMLEIMRDSRIGAHGAAALVFVILAKVAALAAALARRDFAVLLAFPLLARWAVTPLVVLFPYARAEGLGRVFNGKARPIELAGATFVAAVAVAILGIRLVIPSLSAAGVMILLAVWLSRKLGGLTGDVYGAAIELGEVAILLLSDVIR